MKFFIKEARERLGISQKDLALALGIKPTTFNGYETGTHDPKSEMLVKIAAYCDTSVDFLLGLQPDIKKEPPSISTETENDSNLQKLLSNYDSMNLMGQFALADYSDYLCAKEEYRKHSNIPTVEKQA